MKDLYYLAKEVKEKLGISSQTLKRWKDNNSLRFKQIGPKKIWYLKEDVDNLIK